MTKNDLVVLLNKAISILQDNRAAATPKLLDQATELVKKARENPTLVIAAAALFGIQANDVAGHITSAEQVISIERSLTEGETTEKIIGALEALKHRPIILSAIAAIL